MWRVPNYEKGIASLMPACLAELVWPVVQNLTVYTDSEVKGGLERIKWRARGPYPETWLNAMPEIGRCCLHHVKTGELGLESPLEAAEDTTSANGFREQIESDMTT